MRVPHSLSTSEQELGATEEVDQMETVAKVLVPLETTMVTDALVMAETQAGMATEATMQ